MITDPNMMTAAEMVEKARNAPERPCDRLKAARIRAGFTSAMGAAKAMGWKPSTYASHENASAAIRPFWAALYGQAFDVSPKWILTGRDDGEGFGDRDIRISSLARSAINLDPKPHRRPHSIVMRATAGDPRVDLEITARVPMEVATKVMALIEASKTPDQPA